MSSRRFIADHYLKKSQKSSFIKSEPEWLKGYYPQEEQEKHVDIKAKLRGLKKYGYDVSSEDKCLNNIKKQLGFKSGDYIQKQIDKIGVKNLKGVDELDIMLEAEKNIEK